MKILNFYRLAWQSFPLGAVFSTADKLKGRTKLARTAKPRKRGITHLLVGISLGQIQKH